MNTPNAMKGHEAVASQPHPCVSGEVLKTLRVALERIEGQTRGYDSMSTMGILNEIAREALKAA